MPLEKVFANPVTNNYANFMFIRENDHSLLVNEIKEYTSVQVWPYKTITNPRGLKLGGKVVGHMPRY